MRTSMTTGEPLSALARQASGGDRDAFDEIVRRLGPRLALLVRSRMGKRVRARTEVEDVVQETFTRAFQTLSGLEWRGEEAFFSWLGRIAEHLLWNVSQRVSAAPLALEKEIPAEGDSPGKRLRRQERLERLERSLASLPADYRQVLTLAKLERLPIDDIARRMERSPNAVKKLLARALQELKQAFGDTESLGLPPRPPAVGGEEP
jgi:RNA polymerase sigma-70 factor (ECF subfamily)